MKNKDFSYYLSKYLKDYLITERNFSENTLKSYTKTFKLLIEYLVNKKNYKLTDITFSNITQSIIIEFLNYLEEERKKFYYYKKSKTCCDKIVLSILFY